MSRRLFATQRSARTTGASAKPLPHRRQAPMLSPRRRRRIVKGASSLPNTKADEHDGRRPDAAVSALALALPLVERLRQTLAAETRDLEGGRHVRYEVYGLNKNQRLLELTGCLRRSDRAAPRRTAGGALDDLRATSKPTVGRSASSSRRRAVAEIIADAIHDGQSDGTYDARGWKQSDGAAGSRA